MTEDRPYLASHPQHGLARRHPRIVEVAVIGPIHEKLILNAAVNHSALTTGDNRDNRGKENLPV